MSRENVEVVRAALEASSGFMSMFDEGGARRDAIPATPSRQER
jgi:hypothetical protein